MMPIHIKYLFVLHSSIIRKLLNNFKYHHIYKYSHRILNNIKQIYLQKYTYLGVESYGIYPCHFQGMHVSAIMFSIIS